MSKVNKDEAVYLLLSLKTIFSIVFIRSHLCLTVVVVCVLVAVRFVERLFLLRGRL